MALAGLAGKVVIVTGGASGIGAAVVERLLENAAVVVVDVRGGSASRRRNRRRRLLGSTAGLPPAELPQVARAMHQQPRRGSLGSSRPKSYMIHDTRTRPGVAP